jgi:hypothetical protein
MPTAAVYEFYSIGLHNSFSCPDFIYFAKNAIIIEKKKHYLNLLQGR